MYRATLTALIGLACFLAIVLLGCVNAAHAAPVEWRKAPFIYVATDKPLADVVRDFARSQGYTAVVDARIDQRVSVHFWEPPVATARLLASTHGLAFFAEGRTLHVFRSADIVTKVIKVRNVPLDRLRSSLRRMAIEDPRFPLTFDDSEKAVIVHGLQPVVTAVAEAVQSLDEGRTDATGTEEIRVFPLRFAWAQDKKVSSNGATSTVPGVANVLKRLFQGQAEAPEATPEPGSRARSSLPAGKTVTSPLLGQVEVPPTFEDATRRYRERDSDMGNNKRRSNLPQIEADGQMNAVIVRDLSYRMDWYTKLIATLDVKPVRVEIEARIIDIEASSLDKMGIRWQLFGERYAGGFNANPGTALESLGGGTLTTLVGGGRNMLLASLSALAQRGKARVVAQPKVLTLNNVEASLSNTETYYVRVAGNLSAELFNVSTGTKLRVTPLVSSNAEGRRVVKLAVEAQDGDFSNVTVDQMPIVKTREISTQALINEGESLLIGGLVYEREGDNMTGIPVLSQLPVLGRLFRETERTRMRVERLFLITPRVVDENATSPEVAIPAPATLPPEPQRVGTGTTMGGTPD